MQSAQDWSVGTDTVNDAWIFDAGTKDRASLIVVFKEISGQSVAELYDDENGDGQVSYHLEGTQLRIDETPYWTLQVIALGGWLTSTGSPNLNVQAALDKYLVIGFSTEALAKQYMPHDGKPDIVFEMHDVDANGQAEDFIYRVVANFPKSLGVVRSMLYVNVAGSPSLRPDTSLFWPFLDFKPSPNTATWRFFERTPTVIMDWQEARIVNFELPGYPVEEGYFVKTAQLIRPGEVNNVDIEMPHAYYDLAQNRDRYPELNIRFFTDYLLQDTTTRWQEIRYSWNQFHPGTLIWDYKLGLMADYPVNDLVKFPAFTLKMIPYEQLPYWVTEREWKLTTFVANEGGNQSSSEGIYAWSPWSGADPTSPSNPSKEALSDSIAYLTGSSSIPPYKYFADIWEGYRGEYNFSSPAKPELYFSPIDRRLHLKSIDHGLLNLGDARFVAYENDDQDGYIEQWRYFEDDVLRRQLYYIYSYLLYTDGMEVRLKRTDLPQAVFETLPPRTHAEWQKLGQRLPNPDLNVRPDDFKSMLTQISGSEWSVTVSSLSGFRLTPNGFRFVLDLRPGFKAEGSGGPDVADLQPGSYLVNYDGQFTVAPLTSARPQVVPGSLRLSDPSPVELEPIQIEAVLENNGLEDVANLRVQALVNGPGLSSAQVITETEVALLGGQTAPVHFDWTPPAPGEWQISLVLLNGDDPRAAVISTSEDATLKLEVTHRPALEPQTTWEISNVGQPTPLLLLLTGLGLGAAAVVILGLRGAGKSG